MRGSVRCGEQGAAEKQQLKSRAEGGGKRAASGRADDHMAPEAHHPTDSWRRSTCGSLLPAPPNEQERVSTASEHGDANIQSSPRSRS